MRPVFHEDWCPLHLYHQATCACPQIFDEHPPTDTLRLPDAGTMNALLSALTGDLIDDARNDGFRLVEGAEGQRMGDPSPAGDGVVLAALERDGERRLVVVERGSAAMVNA